MRHVAAWVQTSVACSAASYWPRQWLMLPEVGHHAGWIPKDRNQNLSGRMCAV